MIVTRAANVSSRPKYVTRSRNIEAVSYTIRFCGDNTTNVVQYIGRVKNVPLSNIVASTKPFWTKFCPVIGNLYAHTCTKFSHSKVGLHHPYLI